MPRATVTIRELKNKETGIDLTVPTHKETRGKLLNATVEFHIVVVSKLSFFKSPSHKETDVVQYMIPKKFTDFEELHIKLNTTYPATIFPMLPKKALIINDAIIKDRRVRLDELVKFIAAQKKLASCSLVLEFLGVNPITAGSFRKTPLISVSDKEDDEKEGKERSDSNEKTPEEQRSEVKDDDTAPTESPSTNMFGEEEEEDLELFTEASTKDHDIFENTISDTSANTTQTRMFDEKDLGGGVSETEAKRLYLLPGESENPDELKRRTEVFEVEDNSELLTFDEDFESLMITEADKAKASKLREASPVPEITQAPKPQSDPLNVFSFPESPEQSTLSASPKSESPVPSTLEQESESVTMPTKPSIPEPDSDSDTPASPVPDPTQEMKPTPPTSPRPKPTPVSKPTPPTSPKPSPASKPNIPTSPTPISASIPASPTSPKPKPKPTSKPITMTSPKPKPTPASKPITPTSPIPKPTPASKPITPTSPKPKPTPSSKPITPVSPEARPVPTSRPTPAPRTMPVPAPRASKGTPVAKHPEPPKKQESREDNLGTDDLMKYIQENAADEEADLDLFS